MKHLLLLLLLLLATSRPTQAQQGRAYWEAKPDSLERVLARQHADTARLRTVQHLLRLLPKNFYAYLAQLTQASALAGRLHRPDYPAYRQQLAGERLRTISDVARDSANQYEAHQQLLLAKPLRVREKKYNLLALDSLKAAIQKFDALGYQEPVFIESILIVYDELDQWDRAATYYREKLAYYEQQETEMPVSIYNCCLYLSMYYRVKGDYNQAISYSLRAAELAKSFSLSKRVLGN